MKATIDSKCCAFVVGSAGTASSGVIDDLQGLADLCACNPSKFWYHIDGAIGAVACCSARLRPLFTGIERADSIAFDLHKWLFVPYECGCILIRDGRLHRATFSQPAASYLTKLDGGIFPTEGEPCQSDYVLELSRSMKSLKVWMTFKTYGIQTLGQIMEQNVDQAKYFADLVKQHPTKLQLLSMSSLNIICFRYQPNSMNSYSLNELNKKLLVEMQERGIAVLSACVINESIFALRMCITNHRTRRCDLDSFIKSLIEIGDELSEIA